VTTLISTLGSRTTSLEKDIENSLLVSERRARKLDELYREASAENEALYERFNSELSRVAKEVKMGGGEEMIRTQLKEAVDEVARLTKENLRLKREIAGLRAQQPEIDECVKITP
jgi:chromosome segregation ATPase